jgi:dihydrolipoamide dehydrogenase
MEFFDVIVIGGHVAELVAGATGMLDKEDSAAALADTVHPHPTLSEALMEAAQGLCGRAIHI